MYRCTRCWMYGAVLQECRAVPVPQCQDSPRDRAARGSSFQDAGLTPTCQGSQPGGVAIRNALGETRRVTGIIDWGHVPERTDRVVCMGMSDLGTQVGMLLRKLRFAAAVLRPPPGDIRALGRRIAVTPTSLPWPGSRASINPRPGK